MSVVAISETAGSLGSEIGRAAAETLGYEFADREIITKAADRFGEAISDLAHATEERPTVWERLMETQQRTVTYVEATVLEMAARVNIVLVGRAATIILSKAPHTLRVRISAPQPLRARRLQGQVGEAAMDAVRRSDRERAARVRFLYRVDWNDPALYDLVLNSERLSVDQSVRLIRETLADERFRSTPASRQAMLDLSSAAQARAALLANPKTRALPISVACADGIVSLSGTVDAAQVWEAVHDTVAGAPGVMRVRNEIALLGYGRGGAADEEDHSHHQYLHGESRTWGGYGGEWYERERRALQKYFASRAEAERLEQPRPHD